MKVKINLKKILLAIFVAILSFSPTISFAQIPGTGSNSAIWVPGSAFRVSNAITAMNGIFNDLGLDKGELKYSINEMNVSRRKKQQPQVSVTFEPSDPVPGEKVTAIATPTYFMNDAKDLYFTWFLKTEGTKDLEDMKIKAARIAVNNDFDWENASYDKGPDSDEDRDGYEAPLGGDDQKDKENYCFIHDVNNGNDYQLSSCSHLFPDAPGDRTGDGCFSCAHGGDCRKPDNDCSSDFASEEKFWRTDPTDEDTSDIGQMDEANVAGLGATKFSWIYSPGDKVGVVVEGISIEPAQQSNSAYRIMWAFPVENSCQSELKSHKTWKDTSEPNYYFTDMSAGDIDDCLEDNLLDPAEGGGTSEKMDISLSHIPDFPINDPVAETDEGDELIINSSVTNAKNLGYLKYSWQVYKSNEPNPDSWGQPIPKSQLIGADQLSGMNLDTLRFKLKFPGLRSPTYLKVKLLITENVSSGVSRKGHASIVIPIFSTDEKILSYTTSVSNNLILSGQQEICREGLDKAICPVTKDQIITLKVKGTNLTDFLWTVNGEPLGPLSADCSSGECNKNDSGSGTNTAYFAVLDDPGETYAVNVAATNQTTGQKINMIKNFKVIEPDAYIYSNDSLCYPLLLGKYVDLDGKEWPDVSQDQFEAGAGNEISLKPEFNGFYAGTPEHVWNVDGVLLDKTNASMFGYSIDSNNVITLSPKGVGDNYSVAVNALYTADNLTKKALNKYWGLQLNDFYEKLVSKGIDIEIVDSAYASSNTGSLPTKKILATVYAGVPQYLAFLLRIALTGLILLFAPGFILSYLPKTKEERNITK